jgi:hypothetical protein
MCAVLSSGIPDYLKSSLSNYFAVVSADDLVRDKTLLSKYVNVVSSDIGSDPGISEETASSIKEALIEYRTKTYKWNRIKAYEVFKNASCDRISKYAPTNIDDLRSLRCLDEAQLELYGGDIVAIVSRILND